MHEMPEQWSGGGCDHAQYGQQPPLQTGEKQDEETCAGDQQRRSQIRLLDDHKRRNNGQDSAGQQLEAVRGQGSIGEILV